MRRTQIPRILPLLSVFFLLLLAPEVARGQAINADQASDADRAAARELTMAGLAALDRRDYVAAEKTLEQATGILWAPTIGLGLGRARAGLGKLVSAQEAFNRVTAAPVTRDSSPAFQQAVLDASRELEALRPRIPKLVITVRGATTAVVTFDGARVAPGALGAPRPADPGQHIIRARAPGFAPSEVTVTLVERTTQNVILELKPGEDNSPPDEPAPVPAVTAAGVQPSVPAQASPTWTTQRTLALVSGGVGVVGLVVGGVYGMQVISSNNSSKADCSQTNANICTQQGVSLRNDAFSDGTISTAAFVAGGVLAAGGVVLLLTAPSSDASGVGRVEVLPTALGADIGIGLRGTW